MVLISGMAKVIQIAMSSSVGSRAFVDCCWFAGLTIDSLSIDEAIEYEHAQ
jgi:hypothetical protein